MPKEPTPKIFEAITKVQSELAKVGISKDHKNKMQGYQFRGIDDVYKALAPLLAKHKLCIIPKVLEREVVERTTKAGGALFYVTVKCDFDFISSEDGSIHTATMYGEAMDSGDKATNKAMSSAYKYVAFQVFCIPTEGDNDADSSSHEVEVVKSNPKRRGEIITVIEGFERNTMLNEWLIHNKDEMASMAENDKKILRKAVADKKSELEKEGENGGSE